MIRLANVESISLQYTIGKRETQDALGRWFYPSLKFRIFFKNITDSRKMFLLGMEPGGDVKF